MPAASPQIVDERVVLMDRQLTAHVEAVVVPKGRRVDIVLQSRQTKTARKSGEL